MYQTYGEAAFQNYGPPFIEQSARGPESRREHSCI